MMAPPTREVPVEGNTKKRENKANNKKTNGKKGGTQAIDEP
jgi:hypothetical protein